jgi:hypothetical protein
MLAKATPDLSACADKRHSEQSRAGVTDECFGVAAVGFQHFERTMPVRGQMKSRATIPQATKFIRILNPNKASLVIAPSRFG